MLLIAKQEFHSYAKSIDKDTLAVKALSIMNERKITCLCVHKKNNKKKTIGILHIHNILEANIN